MPPKRLHIALTLILGIALVASLAIIIRQSRRLATYQRQQTLDLQSLHQLQEALRQRNIQKTPAGAAGRTSEDDLRAALAKRDATIDQLSHELSDAHSNIMELQAQLVDSNDESKRALASVNELLQKEQGDAQSQLNALKQELDSAEDETQESRRRITALEADNAKLRSASSEGSVRSARFGRMVVGLQDLDRRRETYLTSIMRRYRDITSQFQAMSGMLDASRNSNSSAFSGEALSRIQNAVSLADDDLRRLNNLNAQARQLEKKLTKKK